MQSIKKIFLIMIVLVSAMTAFIAYWAITNKIFTRINLYAPETRVENFRSIDEIFDTLPIEREITTTILDYGEKIPLPTTYNLRGKSLSIQDYLSKTDATGLLVMKNGQILFEEYYLGTTDRSRLVSMSIAKSLVSALVGVAIDEKLIGSIDDLVTDYLPYLNDTGYQDVTVEHLLQMSSGVSFSEAYDDINSEINQMVAESTIWGRPIAKFPKRLVSTHAPGDKFNYSSMDTQILGLILEEVTGAPLTKYIEKKLWGPLGMESGASWVADGGGDNATVFAFCCINAILRDYARFGQLYLQSGEWRGEQIVPRDWVKKSTQPDLEYPSLKDHYTSDDWEFGYQYQWWMPRTDQNEFMAIGVWGQYIYVNPQAQTVIVKTSVDPGHGEGDFEALQVFRAIVESL